MIWGLIGAALAGPWTRAEGSAYVKTGADYYRTTKYVLPAESGLGATGDFGTNAFFGHQYSIYAEVGVSEAWPIQIAARLPFTVSRVAFSAADSVNIVDGTSTNYRGGDMELMPQVALTKKHPIAFGLGMKLPLYNVDHICEGSIYRDFCGRPGDGQLDLTPTLSAGASFLKGKAWAEGAVGYRHRTEIFRNWTTTRAFVDGLAVGATVGAKAGPFIGMVRADAIRNFTGFVYQKKYSDPLVQQAADRNGGQDPFTRQSASIGPQAMAFLTDHLALEARTSFDVWARSTSLGVGFGLGLSWNGQLYGGS
ncbi:MAG: hypothetical protein KC656_15850 [Myxococcales bacterium]|nr:hypothetical protein [Myxococcales bacterium]MCB9668788.1 hypothetical protein [Alphaproteobacteria bacterium]MCB9691419.1 hypothetical protein [Alphaproteobacteria bacterium]